jgi:hypothetical protein
MKKITTINTRWEYYVSNVAGMIIVLVIMTLCFVFSMDDGAIGFTSVLFWVAIILLIIFPFALISFFSSMKSVIVTDKGLTISYVFQKHKNNIIFADVVRFYSSVKRTETIKYPAKLSDSFTLTLADGRVFSFTRSQFDNYYKLKEIVYKAVVKK